MFHPSAKRFSFTSIFNTHSLLYSICEVKVACVHLSVYLRAGGRPRALAYMGAPETHKITYISPFNSLTAGPLLSLSDTHTHTHARTLPQSLPSTRTFPEYSIFPSIIISRSTAISFSSPFRYRFPHQEFYLFQKFALHPSPCFGRERLFF